MSKNGTTYFQRLHALDITTGAELEGGPITVQASYPGTGDNSSGGNVVFDPKQYKERAALLLLNGVIYTSWASHCDIQPYTAWIMAYNETTLAQTAVLNLTPNGSEGSVWQSGGGLAADPQGNIYALIANGTFDTTLDTNGFPSQQDYGNGFVKISTTNGALAVADYFNMSGTVNESGNDTDLGSGGAMVLPDLTYGTAGVLNLAVGAGKDKNIYVVNRNDMGKWNASSNQVYQELAGALPNGIWGVPAYFNNTVYYCDVNATLKSFSIANGIAFRYASAIHRVVYLSRRSAKRLSQRHVEWHRLGDRKYRPRHPARLCREQHRARALQQQPGRQRSRPFRQWEQIRHADDRGWQSLRRNIKQRRRIRIAAVAQPLLAVRFSG